MSIELDLSGKVVLVTGGTKGVGRGIATRFADAGATIAVCARNPVDDLPSDWTFLAGDIRDGEAAFALIDAVVDQLGSIDVLVNNAGGGPPADTTTASPRFTERIVALNLLAPIFCSQRANHWMQEGDGGSIINISSVSGMRPSPTSAAYGAAKAGLVNFTMTAAMEWAPAVRVNCVTVGHGPHRDRAPLLRRRSRHRRRRLAPCPSAASRSPRRSATSASTSPPPSPATSPAPTS